MTIISNLKNVNLKKVHAGQSPRDISGQVWEYV